MARTRPDTPFRDVAPGMRPVRAMEGSRSGRLLLSGL
jgi:hypothetical protein